MVLKSEKGVALVMVILIGLMATVLGTALFHVSRVNAQQAQNSENQLQAEYYARSGVEIAVGLLKNPTSTKPTIGNPIDLYGILGDGTLVGDFVTQVPSDYTIRYKITLDTDGYYSILSTGRVLKGSQQSTASTSTVKYKIKKTDLEAYDGTGSGNPGGNSPLPALFARDSITMNGTITGDVLTNATASGKVVINNTSTPVITGKLYVGKGAANPASVVTINNTWHPVLSSFITGGIPTALTTVLSYPIPSVTDAASVSDPIAQPTWPTVPKNSGTLKNQTPASGSMVYYDTITANQGTVTIPLSGNRTISVNKLELNDNGKIKITGTGTLNLYVNNSISIGNSNGCSINAGGNPQSLVIHYRGSNVLSISGSEICGSLYSYSSSADISFAGAQMNGNVFMNGNSFILKDYGSKMVGSLTAPNAEDVQITSGASLTGNIDMDGNGKSNGKGNGSSFILKDYGSKMVGNLISPCANSVSITAGASLTGNIDMGGDKKGNGKGNGTSFLLKDAGSKMVGNLISPCANSVDINAQATLKGNVVMGSNANLNGNGNASIFTLKDSGTTMEGDVIGVSHLTAATIGWNGALTGMLYAPEADVIDQGIITGTVISKTFLVASSSKLIWNNAVDSTPFFKSLVWGTAGPPSLGISDGTTTAVQTATGSWWGIGTWEKV